MAATSSTSARSGSARRGGSMLQKIAQKKEQWKLYPRMRKIERISMNLSCQVNTSTRTDTNITLILSVWQCWIMLLPGLEGFDCTKLRHVSSKVLRYLQELSPQFRAPCPVDQGTIGRASGSHADGHL